MSDTAEIAGTVAGLRALDIELAETARDLAILRAEWAASESWKSEAMTVIFAVAQSQPTMTTDDVWDILESPLEPRVMGAMMRNAQKEGWIKPLNMISPSRKAICHRRSKRVWKSLLWGADA